MNKGFATVYLLISILIIATAAGAYLVKQTVNFQPKPTIPGIQPTPTTKSQNSITTVPTVSDQTAKFLSVSPAGQDERPSADLISTVGWKKVSAKTYSIMVPSEYVVYVNDDLINLRKIPNQPVANFSFDRFDANAGYQDIKYDGGSLRAWYDRFFQKQHDPRDYPVPSYTITEKRFGSIEGLEVIIKNNQPRQVILAKEENIYLFGDDISSSKSLFDTIVSTTVFY